VIVTPRDPTRLENACLGVLFFGAAVLFFGAAVLAGCGGSKAVTVSLAPEAPSAVVVGDVVLKNDDGLGNPAEETKLFLTTNRVQHFELAVSGYVGPGTKMKWVFTTMDTMAGKGYALGVTDLVVREGMLAQRLRAHVEPDTPYGWPVGRYRAEVFIEDKLVQSRNYTVEPPPNQFIAAGHWLFRDNGHGERGERVQHFAPDDGLMHFEVGVGGRIPEGTRARWTFIAVDTTDGGYREVTSFEGPLEGFGASLLNTLTAKIRFPFDWAKGTYAFRLALNDKTIYVGEFKIK
jgi:hypothetical protein